MAKMGKSFDISKHEKKGFSVIPKGDYKVEIKESNYKATAAGTGHFLGLVFEVVAGDFKGRKIWVNLNLDNPSKEAVEIARDELGSIHKAIGIKKMVTDSERLHNKIFTIELSVRMDKITKEEKNVVSAYVVKGDSSGGSEAPWEDDESAASKPKKKKKGKGKGKEEKTEEATKNDKKEKKKKKIKKKK